MESETQITRLERLGRMRPEVFKSFASELAFVVSIMLSIIMAEYYISGFNIIVPSISQGLSIPIAESIWPASAFSLVAGSFFLLAGRLADMYGAYYFFIGGLAWQAVWSIGAGFSQCSVTVVVCRALQGFGPACCLPASLMLISKTYRPGPRKNIIFSIYGACGPVGFFTGIVLGGVCGNYLTWRWYFWIGSTMTAIAVLAGIMAIPNDSHKRPPKIEMDYWGSISIVTSLILTVAAITQSSREERGWQSPYIITLFVLGLLAAAASVWIEGWVAKSPLLPPSLFKVRGMLPLTVALLFSYGVLGTYLYYTTFYLEDVLHLSPITTVAWFIPFCLGGLILPAVIGLFLHLMSGTILLIVSAAAWVAAPVLISFTDARTPYWRLPFPAMICGTLGIDIAYSITNIWITTSLVESQQGLAGALINTLMFLGNSFFLGWADVIHTQTQQSGRTLRESYQIVLWYISGCAGVALVLFTGFIRVGTAKSDLTADEKERAAYDKTDACKESTV